MKKKWILLTILFGMAFSILAQEEIYKYKPSDKKPYGLPNPVAPEQVSNILS